MSLVYYAGDERPAWKATVTVNGTADDMSSGYTFQTIVYTPDAPTDIKLTKTTNIAGGPSGVVTVSWVANELAIAPGTYVAQLKASRTSDAAEWTIHELLEIRARA